jgi:hypothetical protein
VKLERKTMIPLLPFFLLLAGCAAVQKKPALPGTPLESVAARKYGAAFRTIFNSDRRFAVVLKREKNPALNPHPPLQFFIWDAERESVVFDDEPGPADVRWIDSREIEVTVTPGAVSRGRAGEIAGYRFDVSTGGKSPIPGGRQSRE